MEQKREVEKLDVWESMWQDWKDSPKILLFAKNEDNFTRYVIGSIQFFFMLVAVFIAIYGILFARH